MDRHPVQLNTQYNERKWDVAAGLKLLALRVILVPLDWAFAFMGPRYPMFLWVVSRASPALVARVGRWKAIRAADRARASTPAYREFLDGHHIGDRQVASLDLPPIDKDNYIRAFPISDRCAGGSLPLRDVAIDESSGSSGVPYNWVRSIEERAVSHITISHFARYDFGPGPWITINAFSMGAWATGINMGVALQRNGIVKSTGPDLEKIFSTLEYFGAELPYLVCGYPPFLKYMIDEAEARGFPLADYKLMGLVGGEGMSEGLRDYLYQRFDPVFSGYGATDIEIGLAGETPLAVSIRKQCREDGELREAVFGTDSRLPMVFQYNPLNHYVAVTEARELLFTVNRLKVVAPRIRYNIHDEGGVATFEEMEARFRSAGRELVAPQKVRPLRLPFVWVYGRKDSTLSVMGANIYPEDIEQALYDEPDLASVAHSFCLSLFEDGGSVRPVFSFEIRGEITPQLQEAFETRIVERIRLLNSDFRVAMAEHEETATPIVRLYPMETGPFAGDRSRIKQTRMAATTT